MLMDEFKFLNLGVSENLRKCQSCDDQFVKKLFVVVNHVCINSRIVSVYMFENGPYEAIIITLISNIKDSFTVEELGRFNVRPGCDIRSKRAQTYRQTLYRVEPPPATYR